MNLAHYAGSGHIEGDSLYVPDAFITAGFPENGKVVLDRGAEYGYPILGYFDEITIDTDYETTTSIDEQWILVSDQEVFEGNVDADDELHFVYTEAMAEPPPTAYLLTADQLSGFVQEQDRWATQEDIKRLNENGFTQQGEPLKSIQSGSKLDFDKLDFSADSGSDDISRILSNFDRILELSGNVDSELRPKIRVSLRNLEEYGYAGSLYRNALEGRLRQTYDFSLNAFLESLSGNTPLIHTVSDIKPDLTIDISEGLKSIKFITDETTLEIDDPELLWDCHCKRPRGEFGAKQRPVDADECECPIHSHPDGDKLGQIFLEGIVQINYRKTEVIWYNVPDFWPVSADTIHMYDNLDKEDILSIPSKSILDVGCGTGFLGIGVAQQSPEVRHISMSDWLLTPLVFARINWERNYEKMIKRVSYEPRLGLGFDWVRQDNSLRDEFDLCLCNPPYLPEVEDYPEVDMQNAVGGTDLLEKVIDDGPKIADRVFVNFSDLALPEAKKIAELTGKELNQIGEEFNVPFRVRSALQSEGYMNELESRNIEIKNQGRYKYWHTVRTYEVQPK